MIQYATQVEWDLTLIDLEYTDIDNSLVKGLVCFAIKITTGAPVATAGKFTKACQIQNAYDGSWYENTGTVAIPVWSLVPSTGSGITTLTGDVTAGPGTGSQAATVVGATGNFLVGGNITVTGNIIANGNTTLGNAGTDTITFTAKQTGQLYNNDSGGAVTLLKMHNHLTTAGIGTMEAKGECVNDTGTFYGNYTNYDYTPTSASVAPTDIEGSLSNIRLTTGKTMTAGNLVGFTGQAMNEGTLDGSGILMAGVIGSVAGAGLTTEVSHIAGVASSIGSGFVNPTTGNLSSYIASNLGTTVIDNTLYIQGAQFTTNLLNIDATTGIVDVTSTGNGGFVSNNKGTFTAVGFIRIEVAGSPYFLPYGTIA